MATPGAALQRVLAALERAGKRVDKRSSGYAAQCPAHDDHNPSLSVTPGRDKVLLRCNAGCDVESVTDALGLRPSDLFDASKPAKEQLIAECYYDYRREDGELAYQKVRYRPKTFRIRRKVDGQWKWGIGDEPRVLYKLPELISAVRNGHRVVIAEGEKDVERLMSIGEAATCNFDGASKSGEKPKWLPGYSKYFTGAHVLIIADNDPEGIAHARAIEASLKGKAASVTVKRGAIDRAKSDVSDHLDAGLGLDDLIPLPPTETNGHGPTTLAEQPEEVPPRRLQSTRASEVAMRRTRWLWTNRMPIGGLTLLAGREGLGKSTIAVDLAAQVTRGQLDGELEGVPKNVIYINSEDARDYTIVPRLFAAGADLDRVFFLDVIAPDDSVDSIVLPIDTELLAQAVIEHDAALVVLDAATSVIDSRLDGDKDRQMRKALEAIARNVGETTDCAVLGIVHFGKRESSDTGKLILGSIAWSQVARSTIAVALNADAGTLIISGAKSNLAPADTSSLEARIDSCTVDTDDGPTSVGRVTWLGDTDTDARDLLDGGEGISERTDRDEAKTWLQGYLGSGRKPSADVKKAANREKISERTLHRARQALRVRITAEDYPRVTYWSLPADDDGRATQASRARAGERGGTTTTTTTDLHKQGGTTSGTTSTRTGTTGTTESDSHASHDTACAGTTEARNDCGITAGPGSYASHDGRATSTRAGARQHTHAREAGPLSGDASHASDVDAERWRHVAGGYDS